jgi:YidC/Oxa1 family membrane protein insertase
VFQAIVGGMGRLLTYFYEIIPNYGIAIILLTVLVRLAMIPLAVKQARVMEANRGNQEKMRKLAPEIKKLKEKYKDDRAKLYEEQKKLYDQHGINMLGSLSGCLPMLLQMPIFMAMYQVLSGCNKLFGGGRRCLPGFYIPKSSDLYTAIAEGKARFLTMNLNFKPSQVYSTAGLPEALPYYLLIALMGVTMWYQMKQMTKAQPAPDPQLAQTQKFMQIMPLMFVVFSVSFPVGLTVYWTSSNLWTIGQQYVLLKRFGAGAVAPETTRPAAAPASGFLGRLLGSGGRSRGVAGERKPVKPGASGSGAREKPGKGSKARPAGGARAQQRPRPARQGGSASKASRGRGTGVRPVARSGNGASSDLNKPTAALKGPGAAAGEKAAAEGDGDGAARKVGAEADNARPAKAPQESSGKGSSAKKASPGGSRTRPQAKGRSRSGRSKSRTSSQRKSRGGRR